MSQDPAHQVIGNPDFKAKYGRSLESHLSNPQHLNSYSYAAHNPLALTDHTGEMVDPATGLLLISSFALFVYNGLQTGIAKFNIETMQAYPTVYDAAQVEAAQAAYDQSMLFSAGTSVLDISLISPRLGWVGVGVGYAQVASDALEEFEKRAKRPTGQRDFFETTPSTISVRGGGSTTAGSGSYSLLTSYTSSSVVPSGQGGTVSVPGTNIQRSRDPVGTNKSLRFIVEERDESN